MYAGGRGAVKRRRYVTYAQLFFAGACSEQLRLFKAMFGWKAEINAANIRKACEAGLWVDWYVNYMHRCSITKRKMVDELYVEHHLATYSYHPHYRYRR